MPVNPKFEQLQVLAYFLSYGMQKGLEMTAKYCHLRTQTSIFLNNK